MANGGNGPQTQQKQNEKKTSESRSICENRWKNIKCVHVSFRFNLWIRFTGIKEWFLLLFHARWESKIRLLPLSLFVCCPLRFHFHRCMQYARFSSPFALLCAVESYWHCGLFRLSFCTFHTLDTQALWPHLDMVPNKNAIKYSVMHVIVLIETKMGNNKLF